MAELGARIGVTAAAISRYELGQRELTIDTLQAISAALNIHILDFFYVDEAVKERQENSIVQLPSGEFVPFNDPKVPSYLKKLFLPDPREKFDDLPATDKKKLVEKIQSGILGIPSPFERISAVMEQIDLEGQNKIADYAEDILPRYRAETAPQSTPVPQDGKDTTPAPDTPEAPPEGE